MIINVTDIPEKDGLDSITVYWRDDAPGKGSVTICCYGCAWTAWFGAMGDRTIQQFFLDADTYYMTTKLGITPLPKQNKSHESYVAQIIEAVKMEIRLNRAVELVTRGEVSEPIVIPEDLKKILLAADGADWQQVALIHSYGPPCFHLMPEGRFCLRASSWFAHGTERGDDHSYISLGAMLEQQLANARKEALETARMAISQKAADLMHEHGSYEGDTNVWHAHGAIADFIEGLDDAHELVLALIAKEKL